MAKINLHGVFPPITTPFVNGKVAYGKLASNVEKWSLTGLKGFVVLGSNGEYVYLSEKEKRYIRNVISGSVRHLSYLDWLVAGLYKGKYAKLLNKVKSVLRPAFYEIRFLDYIPAHATVNEYVKLASKVVGAHQSKLVNALLRNFLRLSEIPDPQKEITDNLTRIAIQYSFPEWQVKRWISLWGESETENLCRALNEPPE